MQHLSANTQQAQYCSAHRGNCDHQGLKHEIASCHFQCEGKQNFCSVQLLPAPFPTTKPWRLYCSNMAVATAHRRQGLATALLHRCQRIGDALSLLMSICAVMQCSKASL